MELSLDSTRAKILENQLREVNSCAVPETVQNWLLSGAWSREDCARLLQGHVTIVNAHSPLTLRESDRNRVRHVLGGVRFKVWAERLPLPNSLRDFVILPF